MIFIRSVLFFVFFVLSTTLIAGTAFFIAWFLPPMKRFLFDTAWSKVNLWGLKMICGLDYRLEGSEHIPETPCIVLAKHQSTWETIALISLIPHPKAWVIKRELLFVPIFGWVMIHFRPIAIDRKAGRKSVSQIIEQGQERLDSGLSIIIFPEGTRVAPGSRNRYGIGGALLAVKTGYPVLPVAHNAGVYWKRRGIIKYPGRIEVRIGPLIQSNGKSAQHINKEVEEWIENQQEQMPTVRS
jgi:1-acyl-sn-glycerol-3-phosphate acyltransferase